AENLMKCRGSKLFGPRNGTLVSQKGFRRHDDQRFPKISANLTPQDVKILGRRRQIADLDIIICTKLQKSLKSWPGMFRALTLVSMRKEKNYAAGSLPFRLGTDDELIDYDLGAVGEVAELCFPHAKQVRVIHRISVVKPQNSCLGKHAVVDAKSSLVLL